MTVPPVHQAAFYVFGGFSTTGTAIMMALLVSASRLVCLVQVLECSRLSRSSTRACVISVIRVISDYMARHLVVCNIFAPAHVLLSCFCFVLELPVFSYV